jgi:hypothetical protein
MAAFFWMLIGPKPDHKQKGYLAGSKYPFLCNASFVDKDTKSLGSDCCQGLLGFLTPVEVIA